MPLDQRDNRAREEKGEREETTDQWEHQGLKEFLVHQVLPERREIADRQETKEIRAGQDCPVCRDPQDHLGRQERQDDRDHRGLQVNRVYPDPEVSRVKTVPQDLLVLQDCLVREGQWVTMDLQDHRDLLDHPGHQDHRDMHQCTQVTTRRRRLKDPTHITMATSMTSLKMRMI